MERVFNQNLDFSWNSPAGMSRSLVLTVVLALPLLTWLAAIGSPFTYFRYELPPGQVMYILAKLAGMYAFELLWLQIMYALLKNDPWSCYLLPQWSNDKHRLLGMTTLLTAWVHFLCFFSAVSIRKQTVAYDLLLPELEKGIYFIAVSLGWFALLGMTIVAIAGMLRRKTGGIWVLAHRLSLGVFVLALIHAQMIGSEAQSGLWFFVHLFFAAAVVLALFRKYSPQRRGVLD